MAEEVFKDVEDLDRARARFRQRGTGVFSRSPVK